MSPKRYNIKYNPTKELSLVSFTNGILVDKTKENVKFECFEYKPTAAKSKKKKRIMVAESSRLQYIGYNYGENAPRYTDLEKNYVGVLNKKTGKMRVFPTSIFTLKPYLEDSTEINNPEALNSSYKDRNDLLISAFGGKKKRKSMEAKHRNAIHSDTLKTSANSSIQVAKVFESKESTETTSDAIPTQNKDATSPNDVYDIKTIISPDDYVTLGEIINQFQDVDEDKLEEWKKNGEHSEYFIKNFNQLPKNGKYREHKLKLLTYYDLLTQMLKLKYNDLRQNDPMPHVEDPIKQSLLNNFTISSDTGRGTAHRSMGPKMKDKVISNAMVIALFLENFTIDLSQFQVDFKMNSNKLITIANALGCYTTKKQINKSSITQAELKIPLFNPSTVKKFGKK